MNTFKHTGHKSGYTNQAGLRRHEPTDRDQHHLFGLDVTHEFDDYGNHRIKIEGLYSEWCSYRSIAKLRWSQGWVAATTEYYTGELPRVFVYACLNP